VIADLQCGRQQDEQEQHRERRYAEHGEADELRLLLDQNRFARAIAANVASGRAEGTRVHVLRLDRSTRDDGRTGPPCRRRDRNYDRRGRRKREKRAKGA
jgi:hypothetical protein